VYSCESITAAQEVGPTLTSVRPHVALFFLNMLYKVKGGQVGHSRSCGGQGGSRRVKGVKWGW
jgi:hypothetical protein